MVQEVAAAGGEVGQDERVALGAGQVGGVGVDDALQVLGVGPGFAEAGAGCVVLQDVGGEPGVDPGAVAGQRGVGGVGVHARQAHVDGVGALALGAVGGDRVAELEVAGAHVLLVDGAVDQDRPVGAGLADGDVHGAVVVDRGHGAAVAVEDPAVVVVGPGGDDVADVQAHDPPALDPVVPPVDGVDLAGVGANRLGGRVEYRHVIVGRGDQEVLLDPVVDVGHVADGGPPGAGHGRPDV
ncbi:hypothetical protein ADL26_20590, partial [Thermoactinomyces vulgaris]